MTKRDFEAVAATLRDCRYGETALPRAGQLANQALDRAAAALATTFEQGNPRFKREVFLTACGVYDEQVKQLTEELTA